ncbi:uncharacterized protein [Argopecten irradians]|uniref:uncharacterized protein n=1 Tax=Argopecten irradians TaxID=31199 RepID=UPI0037124C55
MAGDLRRFVVEERENARRYHANLDAIIKKYEKSSKHVDILDLDTLEITTNKGMLHRQLSKQFGHTKLHHTKRQEESILLHEDDNSLLSMSFPESVSTNYYPKKLHSNGSSVVSRSKEDIDKSRDHGLNKFSLTDSKNPTPGFETFSLAEQVDDPEDGCELHSLQETMKTFIDDDHMEPSDAETLSSSSSNTTDEWHDETDNEENIIESDESDDITFVHNYNKDRSKVDKGNGDQLIGRNKDVGKAGRRTEHLNTTYYQDNLDRKEDQFTLLSSEDSVVYTRHDGLRRSHGVEWSASPCSQQTATYKWKSNDKHQGVTTTNQVTADRNRPNYCVSSSEPTECKHERFRKSHVYRMADDLHTRDLVNGDIDGRKARYTDDQVDGDIDGRKARYTDDQVDGDIVVRKAHYTSDKIDGDIVSRKDRYTSDQVDGDIVSRKDRYTNGQVDGDIVCRKDRYTSDQVDGDIVCKKDLYTSDQVDGYIVGRQDRYTNGQVDGDIVNRKDRYTSDQVDGDIVGRKDRYTSEKVDGDIVGRKDRYTSDQVDGDVVRRKDLHKQPQYWYGHNTSCKSQVPKQQPEYKDCYGPNQQRFQVESKFKIDVKGKMAVEEKQTIPQEYSRVQQSREPALYTNSRGLDKLVSKSVPSKLKIQNLKDLPQRKLAASTILKDPLTSMEKVYRWLSPPSTASSEQRRKVNARRRLHLACSSLADNMDEIDTNSKLYDKDKFNSVLETTGSPNKMDLIVDAYHEQYATQEDERERQGSKFSSLPSKPYGNIGEDLLTEQPVTPNSDKKPFQRNRRENSNRTPQHNKISYDVIGRPQNVMSPNSPYEGRSYGQRYHPYSRKNPDSPSAIFARLKLAVSSPVSGKTDLGQQNHEGAGRSNSSKDKRSACILSSGHPNSNSNSGNEPISPTQLRKQVKGETNYPHSHSSKENQNKFHQKGLSPEKGRMKLPEKTIRKHESIMSKNNNLTRSIIPENKSKSFEFFDTLGMESTSAVTNTQHFSNSQVEAPQENKYRDDLQPQQFRFYSACKGKEVQRGRRGQIGREKNHKRQYSTAQQDDTARIGNFLTPTQRTTTSDVSSVESSLQDSGVDCNLKGYPDNVKLQSTCLSPLVTIRSKSSPHKQTASGKSLESRSYKIGAKMDSNKPFTRPMGSIISLRNKVLSNNQLHSSTPRKQPQQFLLDDTLSTIHATNSDSDSDSSNEMILTISPSY